MFQLAAGELDNLKSQIVTSSDPHGGRREPVLAFTEQGVLLYDLGALGKDERIRAKDFKAEVNTFLPLLRDLAGQQR